MESAGTGFEHQAALVSAAVSQPDGFEITRVASEGLDVHQEVECRRIRVIHGRRVRGTELSDR
jgi:hypothetical protein